MQKYLTETTIWCK